MPSYASRVGRWPLALSIAALAACSDDPAARTLSPQSTAHMTVADPFTVTNTNDSGVGSLRWVVSYTTGGETIRFDSSLAGQTITLDTTLVLPKSVTIEGPRSKGITITTGGKGRVIRVLSAAVTFRNLSMTGGDAGTDGGGAILGSGPVVLENSAVYGNRGALTSGIATPGITLINSTVSGNASTGTILTPALSGGSGKVLLINSTVAFNSSSGVGGSDSVILHNSILSDNTGQNCATSVDVRVGTNISDDDTCGGPTQMMIADPKLAALADNGGPTRTHALPVGSPAINAGTSCSVTVDQRYVQRDTTCDLGAYEFTDPTTVTLTIDPGASVNQSNGWAVVTGTVKCSRSETFGVAVQLEQEQRTGRGVTTVDAAALVPVDCSTTVRPWIASMVLTSGAFQIGSGEAKAQTVSTPGWVTPGSASRQVKMYWARR